MRFLCIVPGHAARFDAFRTRGFLGRACTWTISGMSINRRHPHCSGRKRNLPRLAHPCVDTSHGIQWFRPDDDSDSRWAMANDDALNRGRRSRQSDTFANAAEPAIRDRAGPLPRR